MPEYLAPGVYIEEVSFRAKTIEGVSTSTAGFVGPTRYGPTRGEPELITSLPDFERIYGGLDQLVFTEGTQHNFLAHGVRAFFEEGGKRLYVARVYNGVGGMSSTTNAGIESPQPPEITLSARFPGRAGDMRITLLPRLSDNLLVQDPLSGTPQVRRIRVHDTVLISTMGSIPDGDLYDVVLQEDTLQFEQPDGTTRLISSLDPNMERVQILTVDVSIERPIVRPRRPLERYEIPEVLTGFAFHPDHSDALSSYFTQNPQSRRLWLTVPFAISPGTAEVDTGAEMAGALLGTDVINALLDETTSQEQRQQVYRLANGSDGGRPDLNAYTGDASGTAKSGLATLEDLEDISILAAPGYSYDYPNNQSVVEAVQAMLISHCERMRYRIAVLDAPDDQTVGDVRTYRSKVDSKYAAMYYPWVTILDPITEEEINLPPGGFVSGIYARSDVEHGVHKAPANEVVRLSIGFEFLLNKAQQDVLNPEGVNCFRFFEGRGYRLWGARTISSDPEWKYVNLRRYFAYLERSIDIGTQWAVFMSNNDTLWALVRRTVEDFLFNEWKSDRLLGEKPQEAYFVRCDRSTMTQNDIDNGRLICLVGVSPVRPAEFVIFRIGQWTADRRG